MTSTNTSLFKYEGQRVRTVLLLGVVWFVAADVCRVLGIRNPRDAITRLDDDEVNTVGLTDGSRGNPNFNIISESGLYALILRSDKPEARRFRRWVTAEVLPAIRRQGFYAVDRPLSAPKARVAALAFLMAERDRRRTIGQDLSERVIRKELAPRAVRDHPEWLPATMAEWLHNDVYHPALRAEARRQTAHAQGELPLKVVVMRDGRERAVDLADLTRPETAEIFGRRAALLRAGLRQAIARSLARCREVFAWHNRERPEEAFTAAELAELAPDLDPGEDDQHLPH